MRAWVSLPLHTSWTRFLDAHSHDHSYGHAVQVIVPADRRLLLLQATNLGAIFGTGM